MAHDPKLLKKINHSRLIQAANELKIKNAQKVSKSSLADAFMAEVEKTKEAGKSDELSDLVIDVYNDTVQNLNLAAQPGDPAPAAQAPPIEGTGKSRSRTSKKKAAKGEEEEEHYTRIDALCDALKEMKKGGKTIDLATKSNAKYIESGGSDKMAKAKFFAKAALKVLVMYGVAEVKDDSYKIVK